LENVDIFYDHLEYNVNILEFFMTIWYILCSFGTLFPVLVSCTKKNLATLVYMTIFVRNFIHETFFFVCRQNNASQGPHSEMCRELCTYGPSLVHCA
jgi:hypothetical protein